MLLSSILSFAGWSYIPDFATRQLLPVFHKCYQQILRRPAPPPNTPLYWRHYRYVYAFTVITYLLYNFREVALSMSPNYYELLGVTPSADDSTLKMAFRQFARKYHPDRVGPQGEALFIEVRDAFEALKNPVTRFAYDRFGPDAMQWTQCTTLREYVRHGLMQSAGFHIVSTCFLLLVSAIGRSSYVAFWRYLLFVAVFAYELSFILNASPPPPTDLALTSNLDTSEPAYRAGLFALLWPHRVAYQHIRFLHSLFMFLSISLSKVAPVLFPSVPEHGIDPKRLHTALEKIGQLAKSIDRDVTSQIHTELHSVHGPQTGSHPTNATFTYVPPCEQVADLVMERLTTQMENMVIESQLMDGGPLKSAVDTAVGRRRQAVSDVPQKRLGMSSPTSSPRRQVLSPYGQKTWAFTHRSSRQGSRSLGYVRERSQSL